MRPRGGQRPCAALVCVLLLGLGCAAAPKHGEALSASFERPDAQRARELAPDLYARAERALADARAARDTGTRADHAARARLLLLAAIAETERIELERAAGQADERSERALAERAAVERERLALEQRAARERAALLARAQAERVFASPSATAVASDVQFVRERARVTLAAAVGLGLGESEARKVEQRIDEAEQRSHTKDAGAAAERALAAAERALGTVRANTAPSAEQRAALIEMAQARGFAPASLARGVAIPLGAVFAPGGAQPTASGLRRLRQLAALAAAHPQGTILIERTTDAGAPHALGAARIRGIERALRGAIDPGRLVPAPATGPSAGIGKPDEPLAVFSAFGDAPAAKPH